MNRRRLTKWEIAIISPLIILFVCNNYLSELQGINTITMILICGLLVAGFTYDIIHINNKYQIIYLAFLFLIILIWKSNRTTIAIVMLGLLFMMISPEKTVYMYRWILTIQTIIGMLLSIIGLIPIRDERTGVLSLGFSNENGLGAVLEIIAITLIFDLKNGKLTLTASKSRWLFLAFVVLFDSLIINDNTAVLTILILLILLMVKKVLVRSTLMKMVIVVLPIIISSFAIWIGINYNSTSTWMYKLNNAVTQRIFIWNYYFHNYPIQWMPNNWEFNSQIYWGFFDGAYTYFIINKGILLSILLILGLCICNFQLISWKKWNLLLIMLAIEIAGFSENIVITYYLSFSLVFIISAYNPAWCVNYDKKEKVGEMV